MKKLNKKGFTLVELLLVIAIIGILAAVLFVGLGKQRERARVTTFKENMRGLVTTFTACTDSRGIILDGKKGATEGLTSSTLDACSSDAPDLGKVPEMTQCDGDGAVYLEVDKDSGDVWGFQATCNRSGEDNCTAYCTADGCQFCQDGAMEWNGSEGVAGDAYEVADGATCDPAACL